MNFFLSICLVYLHKIGVNERERRRELKFLILKRAFHGLENVFDAGAIVVRPRLLYPRVEKRTGYA